MSKVKYKLKTVEGADVEYRVRACIRCGKKREYKHVKYMPIPNSTSREIPSWFDCRVFSNHSFHDISKLEIL